MAKTNSCTVQLGSHTNYSVFLDSRKWILSALHNLQPKWITVCDVHSPLHTSSAGKRKLSSRWDCNKFTYALTDIGRALKNVRSLKRFWLDLQHKCSSALETIVSFCVYGRPLQRIWSYSKLEYFTKRSTLDYSPFFCSRAISELCWFLETLYTYVNWVLRGSSKYASRVSWKLGVHTRFGRIADTFWIEYGEMLTVYIAGWCRVLKFHQLGYWWEFSRRTGEQLSTEKLMMSGWQLQRTRWRPSSVSAMVLWLGKRWREIGLS